MTDDVPNAAPARWFALSHGLIHALIDAACVTAVFSAIPPADLTRFAAFYVVVGYDLIAFATQAFIGLGADRWRAPRLTLLAGIALTAAAVASRNFEPWTTMVLAGLGNAAFHVGAGGLSLHVQPGRATSPGVFVAPGAIGLAVGMTLGKGEPVPSWPFLAALAVAFIYALRAANPTIDYDARPERPRAGVGVAIAALLLFAIAVRSFVGSAASYACPKGAAIAFGLAFAAFAGKAAGGVLADRLGWIKASVGAMLISAPLLAWGGENHLAVTIGAFLFQMTMPVTLVAVAALLPGRPGFAFGLACVALVGGAVPTYYHEVKTLFSPTLFLTLILLSAAALYVSLRGLQRSVPMKFAD
jgi:FSR family fosmidomycin resistance protein-like MFS transporter